MLQLGKLLVFTGLLLVITGGLIWLLGRIGISGVRLPGDILVQRPGWSVYIPLGTCVLISVILTLVSLAIHYFRGR